jgi:predicted GIY-YIG superfamily endonuclease
MTTQSTVSTTYIYALACPQTGAVRYVGKSDRPERRLVQHLRHPSWTLGRWLRQLGSAQPELVILEQVDRRGWREAEFKWIAEFKDKGYKLLNQQCTPQKDGYVYRDADKEPTTHLGFLVPLWLKQALASAAAEEHRTLTQEIIKRLKESVRQEGEVWP